LPAARSQRAALLAPHLRCNRAASVRDWKELPYVWGPEWSPEFWGKEMNGNFEPR
jgi:hypothetical protein